MRCATFVVILGLLLACRSSDPSPPAQGATVGESVLALGSYNDLLLKIESRQVLSVAWADGRLECQVTREVDAAWALLRGLTAAGPSETKREQSVDPSQAIDGVTLAFMRDIGEGRFTVSYPSAGVSSAEIVESVREVLRACHIDLKFGLIVVPSA